MLTPYTHIAPKTHVQLVRLELVGKISHRFSFSLSLSQSLPVSLLGSSRLRLFSLEVLSVPSSRACARA